MPVQRRLRLLLPVLAVASLPVAAGPVDAGTAVARLAGADRYATAVAIGRAVAPDSTTVFVAAGDSPPDALAAGPAARLAAAPLLLVEAHGVPAVVEDDLRQRRPRRVVIVGGPAAVDAAVAERLRELTGAVVERRSGDDRYATAVAAGSGVPAGPATTYVASGTAVADALGAGAAAAAAGTSLLLVSRDTVPASTRQELGRLRPGRIKVVGGAAAVSTEVVEELARIAPVDRLAGGDRYATAALVSASAHPAGAPTAAVASGRTFTDALALGAAGNPLLLAEATCLPRPVAAELTRLGSDRVWVAGGTATLRATVDRLLPCPIVGSNLTHHTIRGCSLDDGGIVHTYGRVGVRARVRDHLAAMRSTGTESLRLIVWHTTTIGRNTWGVVPSSGGRLVDPYRRNLTDYLSDVREAGFERLTVSFAPMATNNPADAGWRPAAAEENWQFLADVRRLAAQHGPASVGFDIKNEGPLPDLSGTDRDERVTSYLATTYRRYVAEFGSADVTMSVSASGTPADVTGRLENLDEAVRMSKAAAPRWFELHISYTRAAAEEDLEVADEQLTRLGYAQPIVVGETGYESEGSAAAIADLIARSTRVVREVLPWPLTSGRPCANISVSPPYTVRAYRAALRPT